MTNFWQTYWRFKTLELASQAKIIEYEDLKIEKRSIWLKQFWLFILWINNQHKLNYDILKNICKKEKALFIQIETYDLEWNILLNTSFNKWYYKKFITAYTIKINLDKNIDEIMSSMKPKWRYNINLAIKKWCIAKELEKTDENIKMFYNLIIETTSRNDFSGNSFDYYKNFLLNNTHSSLIWVFYEEKLISSWIFIFDKEVSIYYYGASTSLKEYRNLMGPYLMQYLAINKAISIGGKYYDFLWIATPGDNNSSLLSVTDFKTKFSSDIINCSESYIWINKVFVYNIIVIIKKIKNIFTKYEKK